MFEKIKKNRWIICITAVLGALSLSIDQNKVEPIIGSIVSYFHVSEGAAGLTSSIFTIVGLIAVIPAASIIHKFTIRKTAIICLFLALIGALIGALTNNFNVLIMSRALEGVGVTLIAVAVPTLISMWFKPKERGLPMAIWVSWMTTAQTVVFFVAPILVKNFGWRAMWWFSIINLIIGLILYFIFIRTPFDLHMKFAPGLVDDKNKSNISLNENKDLNSNETLNNAKYSLIAGLKSIDTWILCIAAGLFALCSFTFVNWIAIIWHKNVGLPLNNIEPLIAMIYFLEIFYTLTIGYLLRFVKNYKLLAQIGLIIYALLGFISFNLIHSYYLILILIVIFPIFDGGIITVFWTIAPSTNKAKYTAQTMSILNVGLNIGTFLGAPLAGFLLQLNQNNIGFLFFICSILSAITLFLVKIKN